MVRVKDRVKLGEAVRFHGHLGPYLVLGVLAGELLLKILKCKKYFGLTIKVYGANLRPKSCLIDGLQLSTGATYGKGNLAKFSGKQIKIECCDQHNKGTAVIRFNKDLIKKLEVTKTHQDAEALARKLYNFDCSKLFNLTLIT
ncbi:MAG: formylmethanofuran dehydrogenase subunit E family protein [Candidatus Omnitrophica bacterium]|nr:formylmethanofuran dehydrogenase subunit E family protein [Candidatus Omnitrophota bacterium]